MMVELAKTPPQEDTSAARISREDVWGLLNSMHARGRPGVRRSQAQAARRQFALLVARIARG